MLPVMAATLGSLLLSILAPLTTAAGDSAPAAAASGTAATAGPATTGTAGSGAVTASSTPSGAPTGGVVADAVTVNGSGCPGASAVVPVARDNSAFTVIYRNTALRAQAGPDAAPLDMRKNCQVNLALTVPSGYTYAIRSADHQGYARLASGATGLVRDGIYFQGMGATASLTHQFRGPLDGKWQTSEAASAESMVWAPCGEPRNLNINSEVRVNAGSAASTTSYLTMSSPGGTAGATFHLAWRRC